MKSSAILLAVSLPAALILAGCVDPQDVAVADGHNVDAAAETQDAEESAAASVDETASANESVSSSAESETAAVPMDDNNSADADATADQTGAGQVGAADPQSTTDADSAAETQQPTLPVPSDQANNSSDDGWLDLFDGKSLKGWKSTEFGGEGEVYVEKGGLVLEPGSPMTGVHTARKLPKNNFEVELEAQRNDGSDFFVCLSFLVKDKPCSLVLGGWGGGVCGLSSIDDMDASENETTSYQDFKEGEWYNIRLRVTDRKIEAWLGDKMIVDVDTENRELSVRFEVEPSLPFGIASFQTRSIIRKLRVRELPAKGTKTPPAVAPTVEPAQESTTESTDESANDA